MLYDTVFTSNNSDTIFINTTSGSADAFDIDLEAGNLNGKIGICVDVDASYNEGCGLKVAATVKDGLIGYAHCHFHIPITVLT